jgi:hypothetical protein
MVEGVSMIVFSHSMHFSIEIMMLSPVHAVCARDWALPADTRSLARFMLAAGMGD